MQKAVKSVISKFLNIYSSTGYTDVTEYFSKLGLWEIVQSGVEYFEKLGVGKSYLGTIVDAVTRVNYGMFMVLVMGK